MKKLSGGDLFLQPREPEEIIAEAMERKPVAMYAAFSGGDTSLAVTHWMMTNVPGCRVFHANTGIDPDAGLSLFDTFMPFCRGCEKIGDVTA